MLMTKRLWKVKDKRDHPRLDRQWECFQVSREKVASDYLKKKKNEFGFFADIKRSHLTLHASHFLQEDTTQRQEKEILEPVISSSGWIYTCEWVGFHIYTGCCQRG